MTPDELNLILASGDAVATDPAAFSAAFYDTLFELDPSTRSLFPEDMQEQRRKLVGEFQFMISAATAWKDPAALDAFVSRTQSLGQRHAGYGVTVDMYGPVTQALLATLADADGGFDDDHRTAWTKLLRLVSETMLEGSSTTPNPDHLPASPEPHAELRFLRRSPRVGWWASHFWRGLEAGLPRSRGNDRRANTSRVTIAPVQVEST